MAKSQKWVPHPAYKCENSVANDTKRGDLAQAVSQRIWFVPNDQKVRHNYFAFFI
jgi:hypothetical protein